ncbi:MAG: DM13 domain-containing protein [Pseudomonadota bacterium]|nr:DM13 domain-containing protein [Pseudomonadota bacterium]
MKKLLLLLSHGLFLGIGFAVGIYLLPILTQPPAPDDKQVGEVASKALFTGHFSPNLEDSDALHFGDGTFYISDKAISFDGRIAPGPDYRLYLSPVFVETKADFEANKDKMIQAGEVRTFNNFMVNLSSEINPADYNSAIIWCESFSIFITAGRYQ